MKIEFVLALGISMLFTHCSAGRQNATDMPAAQQTQMPSGQSLIKTDTLQLFDTSRNRAVPVVLYAGSNTSSGNQNIVILNHRYGAKNTDYTYIANNLAAHGYVVASIQHELPGDVPIPTTGNVYETRKPFWQRGVENISFVIRELKNRQPNLDYKDLILIGHSNGGHMVMLFAHEHHDQVSKVISLNNRQMPFPRTSQPQLFSLRSSDQPADPGVLPISEEQKKYNIDIVQLKNTIHNDMADNGTEIQKQEINDYILQFLSSHSK